jgi:hypothetical protein
MSLPGSETLVEQSQRKHDKASVNRPSVEHNQDERLSRESDRPYIEERAPSRQRFHTVADQGEESSMLNTTKKKPASRQSISGTLSKYWIIEVACVMISCIATGAIAALLFGYHDRPLETWPSDRITINATISLLTLVAKSSMILATAQAISQLKWSWFTQSRKRRFNDLQIFDNASRGPLGSLELLVKVSRLHLASFGAVVMLVSVALDPFAQQLLDFPQRSVQVGIPNAQRVLSFQSNNTVWYSPDGAVQVTGILS